ncbi:MAG: hypothetical protein OEM62_12525 [Acidobacteriota bacterium]|nr:hypothetical protein [Acidobacteriota bacterium]
MSKREEDNERTNAPTPGGGSDPVHIEEGLCAACDNRRQVSSGRSVFVRCALGTPGGPFARYPRLPVLECDGFCETGGQ